MKQINKLKKIAGTVVTLLILLSLAACGNMLEEANGNAVVEPVETTAEGINIKGQIKLHGAAPSRSATSSFDGTYTWWIMAQNKEMLENSSGHSKVDMMKAYQTTVTNTDSFTLNLPFAGKWTFVIYGYAGSYTSERDLPSTSAAVFICYEEDCAIAKEDADKVITFYPFVHADAFALNDGETSVTGSINLPVTSSVESVYCLSAKLTNNLNTSAAPVKIPAKTFTNGQTSLTASNIPAGIYTANISFEDSTGNTVYSCREAITVYPGLTTDTWFGTAPYLTTTNGRSNFVLTQSALAAYDAEHVPVTNYVLYNEASGTYGTNYQFYHVSDLSSPVNSATITRGSSENDIWYFGGKTFDSEGHIYTLFYKKANGNAYKIYKDGTLLADSSTISNNEKYYERISCDTTTDTFYLATYTGNQFIFKVEKDDLTASNLSGELTKIQPSIGSGGKPYQYAVHDGIIYYAHNPRSESAKPMLLKIDFSAGTESTIKALDFNGNVSINDVLYQDGNVYILISESNTELGNSKTTLISRGGVLKYNIFTKTLDSKTLGWTSSDQNRENKWFLVGWYSNGELNDFLYTAENEEGKVLAKANDSSLTDFAIYSPETPLGQPSTKSFYGPTSFVAIKPKKLVILDEGIAFYTDAEGLYKYKNVNRIVTVDLEDFAITDSVNAPSSITFSADVTGLKPTGCSYNWAPVLYNENHEVIFDASDGTSTIELHSFTKDWGNGNGHEARSVTLDASEFNWSSSTKMAFPLGND